MTQSAKIIDITRTYVPVDENAFPNSLHGTAKEDFPEKVPSTMAYGGHNFLPTSYGYKSYFGTDSQIDIDALESRCDYVFIVQTSAFDNIIVALCEDGIWTKRGDSTGAWTQSIELDIPEDEVHYEWTVAVIGNDTYMYRQAGAHYYLLSQDSITTSVFLTPIVAGLAVAAIATAGVLAAGNYTYYVAHVNSDGQISEEGTGVTGTASGTNSLQVTWNAVTYSTACVAFRVYRKNVSTGAVVYWTVDNPTTYVPSYTFVDTGVGGTTATIPDTPVPLILVDSCEIQTKTPNTLNMAGQMGIFKAGIRLGFWDSLNSISWSSIDDKEDFETSITTLAASIIFDSVKGKIVTIKAHGEGFLIHATKSIVYSKQAVNSTFMWDPIVVLDSVGVAYPHQVTVGSPDTTQFAWTTGGLYKIESGKGEIIVPEIYDFLQQSRQPIYLDVLGGRYMFVSPIDGDYVTGKVALSVDTIPAIDYTFTGDTDTVDNALSSINMNGTDICSFMTKHAAGEFDDQQALGEASRAAASAPAKQAGSSYTPVWTCFLSGSNTDPDSITWGAVPCTTVDPNGVEKNQCPVGDIGKVSYWGDGETNKLELTAPNAVQTFYELQLAIWELEDKNREAYLTAIENRASTGTKTSSVGAMATDTDVTGLCTIGDYVAGVNAIRSYFTPCAILLRRFSTVAARMKRRKNDRVVYEQETAAATFVIAGHTMGVYPAAWEPTGDVQYTSPAAWATAMVTSYNAWRAAQAVALGGTWDSSNTYFTIYKSTSPSVLTTQSGTINCVVDLPNYPLIDTTLISATYAYTVPSGWTFVAGSGSVAPYLTRVKKTETMNASNVRQDVPMLATDTGQCTITGWTYTDINGASQTVPAATTCVAPTSDTPPEQGANTGPMLNNYEIPSLISPTGTFCSIPFEPISLPDLGIELEEWPSSVLTLPADTFLLQDGSAAPIYPTFEGAYVYDLHLKKWGKYKGQYKQLLDYAPINSNTGTNIPYDIFGMQAGALLTTGYIALFDEYPTESYIKYGKIGFYRLGMTTIHEVRIGFKLASTGTLYTETSLDGRSVETMLTRSEAFDSELWHTFNGGWSGRWHNIIISGNFDISHLEFRGTISGRR